MKDRITAAEYIEMMKGGKSKYGNKRTEYNGKVYDSQLEANYAAQLDLRLRAKDILGYFTQLNIPIEGGNYRADFVVLHLDGTYTIEDTKGFKTADYKRKKKQVKERYGIDIVEITE